MPEFDEKKELEEVLTDTKTIQKLLSDNDITDKQIMHTIPVILCEIYPDRKQLLDVLELLIQETLLFHKILYEQPES